MRKALDGSTAYSGVNYKPAPKQWRRRRDSNPRYGLPYDALAKRWFQPLTHVSGCGRAAAIARGGVAGNNLFAGNFGSGHRTRLDGEIDSLRRAFIAGQSSDGDSPDRVGWGMSGMRIIKAVAGIATAIVIAATPAVAQVRTVDPNSAIDADLAPRPQETPTVREPGLSRPSVDRAPVEAGVVDPGVAIRSEAPLAEDAAARATAAEAAPGYERDDVLAAAENTFGKGAEGLAGLVEKLLREQGKPNAYIAGREVGGAFVVGLRYGSGVMTHKVEGERKVYWTGPSLGFDVGGDANKVFVLVYNLYDTQDLFKRFPAAEGRVYFVGGFAATYLRRGNIVMIPIRLGVGWRLGANVGYMRFSETSKWLPF